MANQDPTATNPNPLGRGVFGVSPLAPSANVVPSDPTAKTAQLAMGSGQTASTHFASSEVQILSEPAATAHDILRLLWHCGWHVTIGR